MRVIIYLATNSRRSVPRVGNFVWNEEFGRFLYLGRPLTDPAEINQAAETVFDKPIRNLGHNVSMRVLADEEELTVEETPVEDAPVEDAPVEDAPVEDAPAPKFVIVGNEILMDGKKVAGFTDPENHLRMAHGQAGLREEVEAFLQSK